jgi:hypothetical protein
MVEEGLFLEISVLLEAGELAEADMPVETEVVCAQERMFSLTSSEGGSNRSSDVGVRVEDSE